MILVDWQIKEWAEKQTGILPYTQENINPASIDLRIGVGWLDVQYPEIRHICVPMTVYQVTIRTLLQNVIVDTLYKVFRTPKLMRYRRPTAVLLTTLESISLPIDIAAQIKLKTTPTREGLGHPIADWVDNGFLGQLTLMVTANKTISIYPGDKICQLVLHKTKRPDVSYATKGHYYNQIGATPSWRLEHKE